MGSTQERIKQRREYLKKKGRAYSLMASGSLIFGIATFVSSICFLGAAMIYLLSGPNDPVTVELWLAAVSLVLCPLAWLGWKTIKQGEQALPLPYVPPVTAATLPAEEVLVRGAEEPTQEQSKALLRGTDGSADTGERDLLRSSQGKQQETI